MVLTFESVDEILCVTIKKKRKMKVNELYFLVVVFIMLYKVVLKSLWMKCYAVTIQMKATEQYFPVVLFIMLYRVVLTFESVDEILCCDHSKKVKVTEQYFLVVLFIMLYKVVLTFESVDEILQFTIHLCV